MLEGRGAARPVPSDARHAVLHSLTRILQITLSLPLFGIAAFCVYGFYASFELGVLNGCHVLYGAVGIACLAVATGSCWARPRPSRVSESPCRRGLRFCSLAWCCCFGFGQPEVVTRLGHLGRRSVQALDRGAKTARFRSHRALIYPRPVSSPPRPVPRSLRHSGDSRCRPPMSGGEWPGA